MAFRGCNCKQTVNFIELWRGVRAKNVSNLSKFVYKWNLLNREASSSL